ncbi:PAS domain S-box protein [Marinilabiliaceae bacterium JC017]|nr:PAS domain S-box protein [Marinilabiliaceae bacterium JC017]
MLPYKKLSSKNLKRYFSFSALTEIEWYFTSLCLFLLLLVSWSAMISFKGITLSLASIFSIHNSFFIWFVDLLIMSIPLYVILFINYTRIHTNHLKQELVTLRKKVKNNISLAEQIGRGELNSITACADGELTNALLTLEKNLRKTKDKEDSYNWIAKGKDRLSDILRLHTNVENLSFEVLKEIIEYSGAIQGSFFLFENNQLINIASYAYNRRRFERQIVPMGKGLIGAAAYEKQMIYRTEIPDDYCTLTSGLLGDQKPKSLIIVPLLQEEELQGILEIAFLIPKLPKYVLSLANESSTIIGRTIYNLKINSRTSKLLKESQEMTLTLRQNEEQLRENAAEMLATQEELEQSNKLLETQIQEVEHAQTRLQALLTNASEFISIYDKNQELVFESPSVKRILGYDDEDEIKGMDPDLLTPRGYKTINKLFQYLLETPGGEHTAEYTYLKKNGQKLFLETKGKNLLHDPAIKGIIFNTQDITEQKRAEKEERMKSRMQSLSENSPDMIIRINTMGKLVYVNPAVSVFIGLPATSIVKKRINELDIDERFIEFVQNALNDIRSNQKEIISETEMSGPDGTRIMEIKGIPEYSEDKELESVLFVAHDMTELKKIEQEIKEKNKKISDSINYAQRIQTSILPDTGYLQKFFPRSFIFYRPKDVVSGDFPWFFKKDNTFYIAAVDCTGHGVPGALLSFIGYFLLNNIVNTDKDHTAAEILDKLHHEVRVTLKQDQEGANGRDGMDLALCKINIDTKELHFAGAHRPLYLVRDGELIEYKGSRKGIGGKPLARKIEKDFENNVIQYQSGDRIYFFSDGLPDQTGGPKRRKYQCKRIRETIIEDPSHTMAHLSRQFSHEFYDWMGEEKQVDDVLLIGIEL